MSDVAAIEAQLKEKVAWGCRICYVAGLDDLTLGHLSARVPGTDRVLMKPADLGLEEIRPEDVVTIDLDGRKLGGPHRVHYETPIHTEVYRARPDVGAVFHGHPLYATVWSGSVVDVPALTHDGILFARGCGVLAEDPTLLVVRQQGEAMARALGDSNLLFIRNHGVVTVGVDVEWAVLTAVTLERTARMQSVATLYGPPRPMAPERALAMYDSKYNDFLIGTYWEYLKRKATRAGFGL